MELSQHSPEKRRPIKHLTRIRCPSLIRNLARTRLPSPSSIFHLYNFNIIRSDYESGRGSGIAIAIKSNIPFRNVNTIHKKIPALDTLAITINTPSGELLIINIYKTPSYSMSTNDWKALFDSTDAYPNILISGDFNCHHPDWGCMNACPSGNSLVTAIEDTELLTLNDGTPTFVTRPNQNPSAIDISLITSNLYPLCSWTVLEDTLGSDHFPTIITLGIPVDIPPFFNHKPNLKNIDWYKFRTILKDNAPLLRGKLAVAENASVQYQLLLDAIHSAIKSASPPSRTSNSKQNIHIKSNKKTRTPAPWWSEACTKAIEVRKAALSTFRKHTNYESYIFYQRT